MKIKIKPLVLYWIALISSLVIFLFFFALSISTMLIPDLFGRAATLVDFIVLVLCVVFAFGIVFSWVAIIEHRRFIKNLQLENTYALGRPCTFYNLEAFKRRAMILMKHSRLARMKQYIIAFTVASLDTAFNTYKNEDMNTLNYETSQSITEFFENGRGVFAMNLNVYCFNRGVFLIYTFAKDEEVVHDIVAHFMSDVFRIVTENNLKIWAQPFFGVREIEEGDNLTSAIEDAMTARNKSEVNFESYTKFIKKQERSVEDEDDVLGDIEKALKNGEFVPYYQPKYNVQKKKFVGCEVLARWNHPTRGILSPGAFIEKAEQIGLLSAIDIYIFEKALADMSDSIRRGRRVIPVSSNFSLYEFFSHSFLDTIMGLLEKYKVPPELVEIEITETTSQVNQFLSVSVIKKLRDKGIRVLMDDYGVGYSQIKNLENIPFDAIKIDKSFTDQMLIDEKTKSIVKFLIDLGHINGMEVIVEGVEKKEQVDVLKKLHIDTIQGFYYSKALSFKEYNDFLKNNPFEEASKQ